MRYCKLRPGRRRRHFASNIPSFVRFAASGLPAAGAADTMLTIKHNVCTGNNKRTVKITATGRLNTTKSACP